jgi:hypothetical protein
MKTLYIIGALVAVATLLSVTALLLRKLPSVTFSENRRLRQWLLITAALCLLPVVVSGGAWAWHRWHAENTQDSTPALRTRIDFFSPETSVTHIATPFRVSSGYTMVDCNRSMTRQVTYTAPVGATIDSVMAAWENTDGLAGESANASHDSNIASASGSIVGRDRTFFGNCPGGGHGELVLSGNFSLDERTKTGRDVLIKSVEERLEAGSIAGVALPGGNPPDMTVRITFPDDPALGSMSARISLDESGHYNLVITNACNCGLDVALNSSGSLLVHRQDANRKPPLVP